MGRWFFLWLVVAMTWLSAAPNAIAASVQVSSTQFKSDEAVEQDAMFLPIKAAAAANDFGALNRMESDFRHTRARTVSGIWKLRTFHKQLLFVLQQRQADGNCTDSSEPFFTKWISFDPANPTAYIVRAQVLEALAWCLRGSGHADTVTHQGFESFHAMADEAAGFLAAHKKVASVDPEYYTVMERLAIDQGSSKATFWKLLNEATTREPAYYEIYYSAYRYFQPQWYGSDAEIEQLATFAEMRSRASEGPGMYSRFYSYVLDCGCGLPGSMDWDRVKISMRSAYAHYPADWNASQFAKLSCAVGDGKEAAVWFARMKRDVGDAWDDAQKWHACQQLAKGVYART